MSFLSRRSFLKQSAFATTLAAAATHKAAGRTVDMHVRGDSAKSFMAGTARRDVTPDYGVPMWGYSNREDGARDTLDPLYAKAVVLRAGEQAIAIVVTDCGRMPMPDSVARIREAAKASGVDEVIFSSTHTHSGPVMEEPSFPHVGGTERAIIEAIAEANGNAVPAQIASGRAHVDICHNRRFIRDGECYMRWRNAERVPTSPVDHAAGLVRIDDEKGNSIATLVHYACHPVVFGPDSLSYSADWPGEMCRLISESTKGECFFLQGAAGDINPYMDKTPLNEGGIDAMRGTGKAAADAILPKLQAMTPRAYDAPSIAYQETPVTVGLRFDLADPQEVDILRAAYGPLFEKYMAGLGPDLSLPVGALVLNNDLAFGFLPGEPFVQFQFDFANHSPIQNSFLCGYANDFHIYFPTIRDAAIGGYGASTATYVGIGAGEAMTAEAALLVGKATGQFGKLTGPEAFEIKEL